MSFNERWDEITSEAVLSLKDRTFHVEIVRLSLQECVCMDECVSSKWIPGSCPLKIQKCSPRGAC